VIVVVQQYFSYIMVTSFSGGRSWRERPTMAKQLVNYHLRCEVSAPLFLIYKAGWKPTRIVIGSHEKEGPT
jgi:hypothetical protein